MTLTRLGGDGLPGMAAESYTVTEGDEVVGWIVRHEPLSSGWTAVSPDASRTGPFSRKEQAARALVHLAEKAA